MRISDWGSDVCSSDLINCLEYSKFAREKNFAKVIHCENPEIASSLYAQGQGIIFFCGHQSNWEALFLDGTTRMQGVAIGKAIKNKIGRASCREGVCPYV